MALVAAVAAGTVLAACSSSTASSTGTGIPPGPIKLGALLTLSGPDAPIGMAQQALNQVLVSNLNATGGIDGHIVDLITLDDEGNPASAVSQAQVLVVDHVAGVIYAGTAATVNQTVPVFMKHHIPVVMVDPSDQWADGTKYPYFFDNYPLDKPTMSYMVSFAKAKGITELGVIGDGSSDYQQLDADLVPAAKAQGLPIVSSVTYSPTAASVVTQVLELKDAGANGIALLADAGLGTVYDALRHVGWSPTIVTTSAAAIVGYPSLGNLASHAYDTCPVALNSGQQPPAYLAGIMQTVESDIGETPSADSAPLSNDDFLILDEAITRAHSLSGSAIRNEIQAMTGVSFTSPPLYRYTFTATDHDGWTAADMHMCVLTGFGPYDLGVIATP